MKAVEHFAALRLTLAELVNVRDTDPHVVRKIAREHGLKAPHVKPLTRTGKRPLNELRVVG
ncbi:hypothetical protein D9M68_902380 [compost metagenome]